MDEGEQYAVKQPVLPCNYMMIQGSFFSIAFRFGFQGCKRINNNDNNVHDAPNLYCTLYSRIIIKIEIVRSLRVRKL